MCHSRGYICKSFYSSHLKVGYLALMLQVLVLMGYRQLMLAQRKRGVALQVLDAILTIWLSAAVDMADCGCPPPEELLPSPLSTGRDTEGMAMIPFTPPMLPERTGGLPTPLGGCPDMS